VLTKWSENGINRYPWFRLTHTTLRLELYCIPFAGTLVELTLHTLNTHSTLHSQLFTVNSSHSTLHTHNSSQSTLQLFTLNSSTLHRLNSSQSTLHSQLFNSSHTLSKLVIMVANVTSIAVDSEMLFAGSEDKTVSIWNHQEAQVTTVPLTQIG